MRHFLKIAEAVDVMPLAIALQRQPELWNANTLRTTFEGTPHGQVDDIWLRFNGNLERPLKELGDELETVDYPAMAALPMVRPVIFDLMRRVEGVRLGRVMITRVAPGKRILPHADVLGDYANYYQRYHVVIRGNPGSLFRVEQETVCMRTGEVWWFNAHGEHEVQNNSDDDRIHMLADIA